MSVMTEILPKNIHRYCDPLTEANGYLLKLPGTCIAVDAPPGFLLFLKKHNLTPNLLLLTHEHWDHTYDGPSVRDQFQIPIMAHHHAEPLLKDPEQVQSDEPGPHPRASGPLPSIVADQWLTAATTNLKFGTMLETPGHSPGSICLWLPKQSLCFTGDTVMHRNCGTWRITGGNSQALSRSLQAISALPPDTILLPGHGNATTVGNERWLSRMAKRLSRLSEA